jgi:hypothetical protein
MPTTRKPKPSDPARVDAIELIVSTWVELDATQSLSAEQREESLLRLAAAFRVLGVSGTELREVANRPA